MNRTDPARCASDATALSQNQTVAWPLLEVMPGLVCVLRGGRIAFVNSAGVRILGAGSSQDLIGLALESLLAPDDQIPAGDDDEGWSKESKSLPLKLRRCDGAFVEVEASLSSIQIADERGLLLIGRDVTERTRAEEVFYGSQARLETLIANVAGAVYRCTCGADRTMEFISDAIEDISGYKAADIINNKVRSYASLIHQDDAALMADAVMSAVERREPFEIEYRLRHADGSIHWVWEKGTGVFDRDGSLICLDGIIFDVSDRRRAQNSLAESERRIKDYAESASDWFWEMDSDLRFTQFSDRFYDLFGLEPEDVIGKTRTSLRRDHDSEAWQKHLEDIENRRSFQDFHYELRLSNDEIAHIRVSGRPVFDDHGEFIGYRGTGRDVTAEMRAQAAAKRAQMRLRNAIESISEGFTIFDSDDQLVMCNWHYCEIYPKTADLVARGARFEDLARVGAERGEYEDANGRIDEWLAERIQAHLEPKGPFEQQLGDGRWIRVEERKTKDGGTVGTYIDITELKLREEALRNSGQKLSTLISNLPGIIYRSTNDRTWTEEYSSAGCEDLTGYTGEDFVNGSIAYDQLIHPDDQERVLRETQLALRESRPYKFTYRIATKSGDEKWVWEHGRRVSGPDESVEVLEGFIGDITEQKRLEQQLLEADKLSALGQLAGGVAHDFNNILMIISGYTQIAQKDSNLCARSRDALYDVIKATEKAGGLTKQLLVFGRRQPLQTVVVAVTDTFDEVVALLRPLLGETIELDISAPEDKVFVSTDPSQFSQALVNLAINARDAMPGGGRISIRLEVVDLEPDQLIGNSRVRGGPYARISVADQGCGMDRETLVRIFEPFFTTKEQGKGTGLGMAMIYGFAQQSNGSIEVKSELNVGTEIGLYLPVTEERSKIIFSAEREIPRARGETIMVVEDDESLRRLVKVTLEELGYKVLVAEDGIDALEVEDSHDDRIDLLLTDVVMPRMNGIELSEIIRDTRPDVKILFMSGYPSRGEIKKVHLPKDVPLLEKPLDSDTIAHAVRQALDEQSS